MLPSMRPTANKVPSSLNLLHITSVGHSLKESNEKNIFKMNTHYALIIFKHLYSIDLEN